MGLFNEFLGFIVLTGPLWVISLVLIFAVMIGFRISKRFKSSGVKFIGGAGVFLLFVLIVFGDSIVGRAYFGYLCFSKEGDKIYQTVELPREYWGEDGSPKYYGKNGAVDLKIFSGRFKWVTVSKFYVDSIIKIEKLRFQLIDMKTEVILGEQITFRRYFGWLNRFSPAPNIAESCINLWSGSSYEIAKRVLDENANFYNRIFMKPKNN